MEIVSLDRKKEKALEHFLDLVYGEEYRKLAKDYIQSQLNGNSPAHTFLLALDGDRILACASYGPELFTVNVWGVAWVSVHPDYRNRGIGTQIVRACLDAIAAKVQRKVTAILLTYPGKTKLYEKIGFSGQTKDCEGGLFLTKFVDPKE